MLFMRPLVVKDDQYFLADFGLVDYPDKADLTSIAEQIGPKWTIAPEMKRNSNRADGKPADVYSLAKTLWILLTGQKYGFEGRYDPNSVNGLSNFGLTEPERDNMTFADKAPSLFTTPLDDLLRASTDDEPSKRPPIDEFVERLSLWVEVYKDFRKRNPLQWRDVQARLFPIAPPQRAIWDDITTIAEILDYLGDVNNLNHVLLPGGGGLDLLGAKLGLEPGTIELNLNAGIVYIVKPRRLLFENFSFDWEWNYFRLEPAQVAPIGIGYVSRGTERMVEIAPLKYISLDEWERDRNGEREYPSNSRNVERLLRGDLVIFQKTSTYNRITYTYDGRHSQMTTDEFREYIKEKVDIVRQVMRDEDLQVRAQEKGVKLGDAIYGYLNQIFRKEYLERFSNKADR